MPRPPALVLRRNTKISVLVRLKQEGDKEGGKRDKSFKNNKIIIILELMLTQCHLKVTPGPDSPLKLGKKEHALYK